MKNKYIAVLKINWIQALEYRANAIVGLIAIISGLMIEYQIWSLIFDSQQIESIRGLRYFGPSKMSFLNLLLHSFSIIAVFKYQVFLRSAIAIFVIYFLKILLGSLATLLIIFIIFLCLLIFLISFRESKKELIQSKNNLDNIKIITH